MVIRSAKFVKSSPHIGLCPDSDLPEYAFIGRSNVGNPHDKYAYRFENPCQSIGDTG